MACCPPGGLGPGGLSKRIPEGEIVELSALNEGSSRPSLNCYKVGPTTDIKRVILAFSDVWGYKSANHRAFCDALQEALGEDTAVWMPDLFRESPPYQGDTMPGFFGVPRLLWKTQTSLTTDQIEADLQEIVHPHVRKHTKVCGVVGFCYGGWVVGRCLASAADIASCGVGVHPAWKAETIAKGGTSMLDLASRTGTKALLFLPAKQDADHFATTTLVQQLAGARSVEAEVIAPSTFLDQDHGFVSRGDSSDSAIKEAQEKALHTIVEFLEKHLPRE